MSAERHNIKKGITVKSGVEEMDLMKELLCWPHIVHVISFEL